MSRSFEFDLAVKTFEMERFLANSGWWATNCEGSFARWWLFLRSLLRLRTELSVLSLRLCCSFLLLTSLDLEKFMDRWSSMWS